MHNETTETSMLKQLATTFYQTLLDCSAKNTRKHGFGHNRRKIRTRLPPC